MESNSEKLGEVGKQRLKNVDVQKELRKVAKEAAENTKAQDTKRNHAFEALKVIFNVGKPTPLTFVQNVAFTNAVNLVEIYITNSAYNLAVDTTDAKKDS